MKDFEKGNFRLEVVPGLKDALVFTIYSKDYKQQLTSYVNKKDLEELRDCINSILENK